MSSGVQDQPGQCGETPSLIKIQKLAIRVNAIAPGVVATPMMEQITPEFKQQLKGILKISLHS